MVAVLSPHTRKVMAATFVVEDGTGLSNANAYISEAYADQYHEDYGDPAAWSGSTSAEKQEAIRLATRYIDAVYRALFIGARKEETQNLAWPRTWAYYPDGYSVDSDSVPPEIERACAILALKSREGDDLAPDIAGSKQGISKKTQKVGDILTSKTYIGAQRNYKRYTLVLAELRPLLQSTSARERA